MFGMMKDFINLKDDCNPMLTLIFTNNNSNNNFN